MTNNKNKVVVRFFTISSFLLTACSHISFYEDGKEVSGLTIPKPALYLKVDTGAQGGCVATVIPLPDNSKTRTIVPHYWLGTLAFKPTLTDGWNLTGFDSTVDTKIPEMLNAFTGGVNNVGKAGVLDYIPDTVEKSGGFKSWNSTTKSIETTGPGIYKMIFGTPSTSDEVDAIKQGATLLQFSVLRDSNDQAILCPSLNLKPAAGGGAADKQTKRHDLSNVRPLNSN